MRKNKPQSYKDIAKVPINLKDDLPTSYDVIGNIALIKLDSNLLKYKKQIGESLILTNKNIRTVCLVEPVSGEYRTRKIEIIAGENNTKTIHKEYGLKFYVDVAKTYFSPRLANERMRIANQVKKDEIIVDMFTGIAPSPIMIAKNSNPKIIYAVDKNKYAIEYAKRNIIVNNLLDKIEPMVGDSKNIKSIIGKNISVNRIIMNHPTKSFEFFPYALDIVDKKSIIHYYIILPENEIDDCVNSLKEVAFKKNLILENIKNNKIKSYSPHEFYICFDITAKKN